MASSEEKPHSQVEVVFTQKQKIILLLELQKYRVQHGDKMGWESFHKASKLRDEYSHTQISQQCRTLEELYRTNACHSPSDDIRDCRIFQLSHSLWGEREREKVVTKKLVSMVGEEYHSSTWEDDDDSDHSVSDHDDQFHTQIVPDSYDGTADSGSDDKLRKRKRDEDVEEDDVNPKDYPGLVKFLKYDFIEEELKKRWRVMRNENAHMFEKEWIEITDEQVHLSLAKIQLINDMYSSINERKEEEKRRKQQ